MRPAIPPDTVRWLAPTGRIPDHRQTSLERRRTVHGARRVEHPLRAFERADTSVLVESCARRGRLRPGAPDRTDTTSATPTSLPLRVPCPAVLESSTPPLSSQPLSELSDTNQSSCIPSGRQSHVPGAEKSSSRRPDRSRETTKDLDATAARRRARPRPSS